MPSEGRVEPPVPAWAADGSDGVTRLTSAYFGIQGEETEAWIEWRQRALTADAKHAPMQLERARFVDASGVANTVDIAYWKNDSFEQWWSEPGVSSWWSDTKRSEEGSGYWREVSHVTPDRIETLHSSPNAHGIAYLAGELEGPVQEHAYPGAARDRIPVSGSDSLRGVAPIGEASISVTRSEDGKRVAVVSPKNMCIIRSGQDWGHCSGEEAEFYKTKVEPSLRAGMDFLRDNPDEARCLSMRLMRCVDGDNDLPQTFGLGYGLDIYAFEDWAKSHPTHLEIFGTFMSHAEKFGESMQLRLWHEVSVISTDAVDFEYIACHPKTGLLAHAG